MRLYANFLLSLAFGLWGLCCVLKILLDTWFSEWDIVGDMRARWKAYFSGKGKSLGDLIRPEDLLIEKEKGAAGGGARLAERRREQLQELEAAASRFGVQTQQPSDTLASIIPS